MQTDSWESGELLPAALVDVSAYVPPMSSRTQYNSSLVLQLYSLLVCVGCPGGAGVGKSFTTQAIVQQLLDQRRSVAVTASTGTAALNIDGMTVHRWA